MEYVVGSVAALVSGNVTPSRPKHLRRALTPTKHQPSPNVTPKSELVDRSIFLSPTLQKKKAVAKKSPKRIFESQNLDVTEEDSNLASPKADKVKKHLQIELDASRSVNSSLLSPESPKETVEMKKSPKKLKVMNAAAHVYENTPPKNNKRKLSEDKGPGPKNVESNDASPNKKKKQERKLLSQNVSNVNGEQKVVQSLKQNKKAPAPASEKPNEGKKNKQQKQLTNSHPKQNGVKQNEGKKNKPQNQVAHSQGKPNEAKKNKKQNQLQNLQVKQNDEKKNKPQNQLANSQGQQNVAKQNKGKKNKSQNQLQNSQGQQNPTQSNNKINKPAVQSQELQSPKQQNKKKNRKNKKNQLKAPPTPEPKVEEPESDDEESDDDHEENVNSSAVTNDSDAEQDSDVELGSDAESDDEDDDNSDEDGEDDEDDDDEDEETDIVNPNAITNKDSDSEHDSDDEIESENDEANKQALEPEESSDDDEEQEKEKDTKKKAKAKPEKKETKAISDGEKNEALEEEIKRTVFVGNVPFSKKCKKEIKKIFKEYGTIETIRIRSVPVKDATVTPKLAIIKNELHPESSTVNVYVKFADEASAEKALKANNTVLNGNHLRVHRTGTTGAIHDPKLSIFVGNIPFGLKDEALRVQFEKCGEIESVRIVRDRKTHAGKGFGYVNFESKDSVELALAMSEEDLTIKNRILRVMRCTHTEKRNHNKLPKKLINNLHSDNKLQEDGKKNNGAFRRIEMKRKLEARAGGPANKQANMGQPREKKQRKEFVGMTADKKKKRKFDKGQKKKKVLGEILAKK